MKNPILYLSLVLILLFTCLLLPEMLLAQPAPGGAPAPSPIDGGLVLLAAAGGAYACKKLRKKKTKMF